MAEFNSYLGVKFQFDSADARADIIKLLNDLDYFEKKLKNNFDTESIKRFTGAMDTAKQGLYEYGIQVDTVTQQSFQNFRAIGQMDRVTREFASGGLNQGLNGLTMLGNTLTRLSIQEGGFKNAISSLAGAFTGPAGIVLAVSAAVGLFEAYEKQIKKAEEENQKFSKSLDDAKAKGLEQGLKLQELISISEDQTLSDKKRTEALNAVKKAVSEVNAEYGAQIKTSEDAKKAVDLLTQAYIQQAVVGARMAKVAADTIALESAQTTVAKAKPSDIGKVIAAQTTQQLGGTAGLGAGLLIKSLGLQDLSDAITESKRLKEELDKQTAALQDDIKKLSQNPFGVALATGMEGIQSGKGKNYDLSDEIAKIEREIELTAKWANEEYRLYKQREEFAKKNLSIQKADVGVNNFNDYLFAQQQKQEKKQNTPFEDIATNAPKIPAWMNEFTESVNKNDAAIKKEYQDYKDFSNLLSKTLTKDIMGLWDAMQKGENIGDAIGQMFSKLAEQIAAAALQAALFTTILDLVSGGTAGGGASFGDMFSQLLGIPKFAEGGVVSKPTLGVFGEAGPEAVMPLSKLGNVVSNSFSAGAMSGGSQMAGGQFTLRGNDLVLALQRSNYSLDLRRGA